MGSLTNHTHLVELVAEQAAWYRQGKAIEVTMVCLEANMLWKPITDLVTALPDSSQAGRTASLLYGILKSGEGMHDTYLVLAATGAQSVDWLPDDSRTGHTAGTSPPHLRRTCADSAAQSGLSGLRGSLSCKMTTTCYLC